MNNRTNREASDFEAELEPVPSGRAFVTAALVICFAIAVVAIAFYEMSQSSFWQAAPEILQRALK